MRRFGRFNLVGLLGIPIQLSILSALTTATSLSVGGATAIAVVITVVHNYAWHRLWTWRDRQTAGVIQQFLAFAGGSGLVSLAGNVGIVTTLTKLTQVAPAVSSLIAIAVCGLVNYAVADLAVFRAPRQTASSQSAQSQAGDRRLQIALMIPLTGWIASTRLTRRGTGATGRRPPASRRN